MIMAGQVYIEGKAVNQLTQWSEQVISALCDHTLDLAGLQLHPESNDATPFQLPPGGTPSLGEAIPTYINDVIEGGSDFKNNLKIATVELAIQLLMSTVLIRVHDSLDAPDGTCTSLHWQMPYRLGTEQKSRA